MMTTTPDTAGYALNQTMLRVRDPQESLHFYCAILGMTLLQQLDFEDMQFSLYFLAYLRDGETIPSDPAERARFIFGRETTLELTHNWGTEKEATTPYHSGNSDPRGFGHIGISVPDVQAACERFERLGATFVKRPDDGKMKGIAFIADPDGYWIEILSSARMTDFLG